MATKDEIKQAIKEAYQEIAEEQRIAEENEKETSWSYCFIAFLIIVGLGVISFIIEEIFRVIDQ